MPSFEEIANNLSLKDIYKNNLKYVTDLEATNLASNDHTMDFSKLSLRPGSHQKMSFRSTPGCIVKVHVQAQEWIPLDTLNRPRSGAPIQPTTSPTLDDELLGGIANPSISLLSTRPDSIPSVTPSSPHTSFLGRLPQGVLPVFPGGGLFDWRQPDLPPPINPPAKPKMPVEVLVQFQNGEVIKRQTIHSDGSTPQTMEVTGIEGHDIIDVIFINPNDIPITCPICKINIDRKVVYSKVKLSHEFLTNKITGVLKSVSPQIKMYKDVLTVRFEGEGAGIFGLPTIDEDLDIPYIDVGGHVEFGPINFRILAHGELIKELLEDFNTKVSAYINILIASPDALSNIMTIVGYSSSQSILSEVRGELAEFRYLIHEFSNNLYVAYFESSLTLKEQVENNIAGLTPAQLDLATPLIKYIVDGVLNYFPILNDPNPKDFTDVCLHAGYDSITINGSTNFLRINFEGSITIEPQLYVKLHQSTSYKKAPYGDLPWDKFKTTSITPTFNLMNKATSLDLGWLIETFAGSEIINALSSLLIEFDKLMVNYSEKLSAYVTEYLTILANRDHELYKFATTDSDIYIFTVDPKQLQVPHDPNYHRKSSPTEGISISLDPLKPIDHDISDLAIDSSLSPDESLNQINHLVFIMMENRSFDHMLGYLSHPDHGNRDDVEGLKGDTVELGGDLAGTTAVPRRGPSRTFYPNLPHNHSSIMRQINDGKMNGFASEYSRKLLKFWQNALDSEYSDPERVLRFQTPDVVDTYDWLVQNGAICDHWFSSVPAGTYPNRACYYSGITPALVNDDFEEDFGYISDLTIFDVLDHVGVDWVNYESNISFLRTYNNFRLDEVRIRPYEELMNKDSTPLPPVTFIDPNFTGFPDDTPNNDDQPPSDTKEGQEFIRDTINKIMDLPEWDSTMIVVLYDEHGGFSDHVAPPGTTESKFPPVDGNSPISLVNPNATCYGVRVPALAISPKIEPGTVNNHIFDHTSVFKTILQRFAPQFANSEIIPERVRQSRHLGELLSSKPSFLSEIEPHEEKPSNIISPLKKMSQLSAGRPDNEDFVYVLKNIGTPKRRRNK
ncbi:hypothetical protein FE810_15530 [Thalassotalea litorea]|uniref:Phosphoesterase n=1 Tax=Thalassotalea litorea TaxID=2020715 RepID=A0A5R9ICC3_9GAMM|nr:alkaline phosphatase family protein [Thalassotalea litorea]TLU61231.1 hypothetical protein FE810_15530 [Thalassotalea litorea]